MRDNLRLGILIGIILFFGIVLPYIIVTNNLITITYKESPSEKCERLGGIMFYGGLFSTDNCVFPNKTN